MHNVKNVAYLSYDGLTDPLGQSQIIPYVLGLSRLGYQFTIVSFEKKNTQASQQKINELLASHGIAWHPLPYTKQPPVLSTLWDVWRLWRTFLVLNKENPIQLVHCRSYITALVGLRIRKKLKILFLFDMRGFWADERVEGGIWNLRNPLFKVIYLFFKRKELQFFSYSDEIISLTENAKQLIIDQGIKTRVSVIPTCVDLTHFALKTLPPGIRVSKREELNISEQDFLLVYSGSWGTWYLVDEMLRFFTEVLKIKPNSWFLIISHDEPQIQDTKIKQRIIHRKAERHEMPAWLACADASVFFIKPSFSKKASSATKLGELLAMRLPVVTNSGWGDIQDYDGNGVMVLESVEQKNLIHGARWLLQLKRPQHDARLENLSLQTGIQKYQDVYKRLIG